MQIREKTFLHVRAQMQKRIRKLAQVQKHFAHVRKFLQMCKCVNVQMCKCAKNRRAQNAQICSANYFPNAEIANLHCAQNTNATFCTCHNFLCAQFRQVKSSVLCVRKVF